MHLSIVFAIVAGLVAGVFTGVLFSRKIGAKHLESAKVQTQRILKEGLQEAEQIKRDKLSEARDEIYKLRQDAEKEIKERRNELQRSERRIEQKEENYDRKLEKISQKEEDLKKKQNSLEEKNEEVEELRRQQIVKLEEVAGLSMEEGRELLLQKIEDDAQHVIGLRLKDIEEKAKREAERKSREIIVTAVQRCAVEHTSDVAVSTVALPSDEMKGRIIGREGRNIRAFESITGVDLIVDDTPEAVTLSSFDPVRREVARLSLERLIIDGRIHPARIEELVEKATREVEEHVIDAGEAALLETGVKHMSDDLVRTIGQLSLRYSYGQNALRHSLEVSHLSGIMAAELGVDEELARRAGLLHDIGKAVDHKVEGPHALIGADLAKRHNESPVVINAIASHHEDVEQQSIYDIIVAAADAISASRPGARRESLDAYVRRLEKLEDLATSFSGVNKAFAIQAGREVRVVVASNITDQGVIHKLAWDIARKIESEMKYPGQIKVTVTKEIRSVEYAK